MGLAGRHLRGAEHSGRVGLALDQVWRVDWLASQIQIWCRGMIQWEGATVM